MRILIVEDERLIRERLLRMCGELTGGRARFDAVADLDQAGDRLQRSLYDGFLLDLNLGGGDGFDLLRQAVAGRYHCVVVSAHRERALQAFEHGVLDFVPKPFTRERLGLALDRLLDAARYRPGLARYLGIWRAQGTALVELADVLWIRADGDYSEVRLLNGRSELHDKSLAALSAVLPPDFVRCHRSCLVNLRHVRSMHAGSGSRYWLVMANGKELAVGRAHVSGLRRELGVE
ncbi:DNA-binding response regulator [Xanthomonas campestris]|uniref:LytR/AlgR family response regulator transcription factor n=1 Tax=Xanthomonas campestris TaxID=339 RepID=UPI000CDAEC9B|nr:LytTR family DNA-binding domain-containing protein [Xanthomonas campestris]MCW1981188.1 DNA-binding LytR/AlgR family response regulator [Xanthomonas campestris]MCW2006523.1 DNA-binding LytR/AlgR family response regulator [Xanthomonas campestris]RJU11207.1 DNA-binding response regulator [Xanthomonas campestris]TXD44901.1 response regulator transcription factor [Xanthomonas campestris]